MSVAVQQDNVFQIEPVNFSVNENPKENLSKVSLVSKDLAERKLVGVLMSFYDDPNGEAIELRAGRWFITSRGTNLGDYILIEDDKVGPLHGVIRVQEDGKILILDQLSDSGTAVIKKESGKEIDITGKSLALEHGDIIKFGRRTFTACLL